MKAVRTSADLKHDAHATIVGKGHVIGVRRLETGLSAGRADQDVVARLRRRPLPRRRREARAGRTSRGRSCSVRGEGSGPEAPAQLFVSISVKNLKLDSILPEIKK